jgi:PAS domain S-box-containing protein
LREKGVPQSSLLASDVVFTSAGFARKEMALPELAELMDSERNPGNEIFAHGGEMGALMREYDWSKSPLGPVEQWPQSLKTIVRVLLTSRYAMWMGWGPELTFLYNDSYASMTLGKKHPWALGRPASEVWREIWNEIGPRIRHVFDTGEATWDEALLLFLERSGFPEETYHTFSYSPLTGEDGSIVGMLCVVTEETERIIGERQLTLLRSLSGELAGGIAELDVCRSIKRTLDTDPVDLPFTLTYLLTPGESIARMVCCTGMEAGQSFTPQTVDIVDAAAAWPIAEVLNGRSSVLLEDLETRFRNLPAGQWGVSPRKALLVPIARQGQESPAGVFIAALNPFRQLTPAYKGFIDLIAGQIAASLANARAYQEERRRAEALSEIDRAKTAFFTNISHEFRTPLTLMLSPLEEAISREETGTLTGRNKEHLKLAHRNAMRLLKLVNTLLEFSRIEARRANPVYQPTDLAEFTAELASVFRSATEKAGLDLRIECGPLSQKVSVDREMWEKIVLNLLSNAFKFTLEGSITVRLTEDKKTDQITLEVADTGTGIPQSELPRIFERFHRVRGAEGRSIEGTGIGLALVQELVKLHGGSIRAESDYGQGTTFFVTIPRRNDAEKLIEAEPHWSPASARFRAENYVEEALRWLPDAPETASPVPPQDFTTEEPAASELADAHVLLADDNADMREYVRRLLAQRFQVRAVSNGAEALAAALADPPDLVLSDVMMPEMDGFALLRALRDSPRTRSLPVILLSARAGMEARVEGLELGADDYLVKPFTAQELLTRVRSQLRLSRLRREAEDERTRLALIAESSSDFIGITDAQGVPVFLNKAGRRLVGFPEGFDIGQTTIPEYFLPEERSFVQSVVLPTLYTEGRWAGELRLRHWQTGKSIPVFYDAFRMDDPTGKPMNFATVTRDLTEQKKVEEALRRSEKLAVVGRMASSISHEINNPLESVTNLLYLIQSTTAEEKSKSYARTALEELARVSHIVTHTLQFNRQTDEAAPVKLSELLESALAIYSGRLRSSDIRLLKDFDEEALTQSLPSEIRQVFSNLISNAFDAMRSGGTLFLRARTTIHRRTGQRVVRVTIADTGHGMDRETRARIFEPFFTTKGDHGTGLGLWISAEILKRHGAEMRVKSSRLEGHSGTAFSMLFPLHSEG